MIARFAVKRVVSPVLGALCAFAIASVLACASSPLMGAARSGDVEAVTAQLAAGADVDERDAQGNTALYHAALSGHVRVVEQLIAAGADVNSDNAFGSTPVTVAARYGHEQVIRVLAANGARLDDVSGGGQKLTSDLNNPGGSADLIRSGPSRGSPLVRAARGGHLPAVKALVESGASLPAPEAVLAASEAGHDEIAAYLTQATTQARREARSAAGSEPAANVEPRFKASYGRRVAAVVGISRYGAWPPLEGASRDARNVSRALREAGFDDVIEIYDERATRAEILDVLGSQLPARTGPNDLVFIYFAGHGQTETLSTGTKRGYVVPSDAVPGEAFSTGISMRTLRDLSNRMPAKHVYYAMDSCYSGLGLTATRSGRPESAGQRLRTVQMLAAGTEGQQAIERGGRGLFTTYLLRALSGEADANGDAVVTASEIGSFVAPQVERASDGRQTPQYGALDGVGEVAFEVPQ